jgi:hypothetical protein
MQKLLLLSLLSILIGNTAFSQRKAADSTLATPWVSIKYGFNLTGGDLLQRHGIFNHVGFFAGYKTSRNWIYGIDASYLFGGDLRTPDLFGHLRDEKGNITDQNGDIAQVYTYSRGMHVNACIGKILPVLSPNPNSGIYVNMGVGFLAHKVRVETQDHVVPQLELDYRKGYDRLTQGVNVSQFVGYAFMANEGFVNFYAGLYAQEGFTYNMRDIFYDQPNTPVSKDMMIDIQYGIRVGWLIPIYKRQPKDFYFD